MPARARLPARFCRCLLLAAAGGGSAVAREEKARRRKVSKRANERAREEKTGGAGGIERRDVLALAAALAPEPCPSLPQACTPSGEGGKARRDEDEPRLERVGRQYLARGRRVGTGADELACAGRDPWLLAIALI